MSQVRTQGLGVGGAGLQPPKWKLKKHTSSYHLFCGLPLSLVASKFIYNPFLGIYFLPFSVHAQINVLYLTLLKKKGKAVPLQAWSGPEGSRKLR